MGRRRFYASQEAFNFHSQTVNLEADEARHLREVLRLKPGDEVYVFDGDGKEFQCAVESSRRDTAILKLLKEVEPARPESALQLTLAVALLKSDKFDLVVQKATELGVLCVIPVMTKLADIKLRDQSDADKRVARWRRIALEAAKQSGRAFVPKIETPVSFADLLLGATHTYLPGEDVDILLFAEQGGAALDVVELERTRSILSIIGSEGGWTEAELEDAKSAGWKIVTLGGRTLRAETAAITVTALLQHLVGDLK